MSFYPSSRPKLNSDLPYQLDFRTPGISPRRDIKPKTNSTHSKPAEDILELGRTLHSDGIPAWKTSVSLLPYFSVPIVTQALLPFKQTRLVPVALTYERHTQVLQKSFTLVIRLAVVTTVISIPWIEATSSYLISGKMSCSLRPRV